MKLVEALRPTPGPSTEPCFVLRVEDLHAFGNYRTLVVWTPLHTVLGSTPGESCLGCVSQFS